MEFLIGIWNSITEWIGSFGSLGDGTGYAFTTIARIIFVILGAFILLRSILSLIRSKNPSEVWAYVHLGNGMNIPVTHWENTVGRSKSCDIMIDDLSVSRNHGTLVRNTKGQWTYMDLGSKNGAVINGKDVTPKEPVLVEAGDEILIGGMEMTIFPVSVEEHLNNLKMRQHDTKLLSPWSSLIALTIFQILDLIQLRIAMGDRFVNSINIAFFGLAAVMWAYVLILRSMRRKGFEMEIIAFFLTTLSLSVVSTCLPDQVLKQFIAAAIGVAAFFFLCTVLRNLKRVNQLKPLAYAGAIAFLGLNLIFGTTIFGASNWIRIGGLSMQPSEIVKIAFIWVGAATLDELFDRKKSIHFTIFAVFCFACLAKMGDFGTAIIFFATYLIISFMRSGDFTKLLAIVGVAFAGGLLVLRFKSYVLQRFMVWGHVWENADALGYQQTRTMSAAASGGLFGVGAGNGWLHNVAASQTDLVFGVVAEEWGLIIAVLAILSVITLSIFAWRSILSGRSTYYTIAACATTALFLVQTILNVFGSVDILPLTGVTFPFLSYGGTSMVASWCLLAFLKAADTRQNASIAVSLNNKGIVETGEEDGE